MKKIEDDIKPNEKEKSYPGMKVKWKKSKIKMKICKQSMFFIGESCKTEWTKQYAREMKKKLKEKQKTAKETNCINT